MSREGKLHWDGKYLPALADPKRFKKICEGLSAPFRQEKIDRVVAFEASGFPIGAAVARTLNCGLVLMLKRPPAEATAEYEIGTFMDHDDVMKTFQVLKTTVPASAHVVIIDDLLDRGFQLLAAIKILGRLNATIVGASFVNCLGRRPDDPLPRVDFPIHNLTETEPTILRLL